MHAIHGKSSTARHRAAHVKTNATVAPSSAAPTPVPDRPYIIGGPQYIVQSDGLEQPLRSSRRSTPFPLGHCNEIVPL